MSAEETSQPHNRLWYVWDYDIDEETFQAMLDGKVTRGRLGRDWAAVRLLEYAPYPEIVADWVSQRLYMIGHIGEIGYARNHVVEVSTFWHNDYQSTIQNY